jgi:hypothetical protein
MNADPKTTEQTTDLDLSLPPPGFSILNDGPGREVLVCEGEDIADVYPTRDQALDAAWIKWQERQSA